MRTKSEAEKKHDWQVAVGTQKVDEVYCGGTQSGYHMFEFFSSGNGVFGLCNRCLKQVKVELGQTV